MNLLDGLKFLTFSDVNPKNPPAYNYKILENLKCSFPNLHCSIFKPSNYRFQQINVKPLWDEIFTNHLGKYF